MITDKMSEHEYHSRPELSSTGARLLLESPAKFKYRQDNPLSGRVAFDVGTAVHTKVLGIGAGIIEYPEEHLTPSGFVSTKAATLNWADARRSEGLTPISPADAEVVNGMAEAVLAHPMARALLEMEGQREVSVFSEVEGVPVRARFDALTDGDKRIGVDLKTTRKKAEHRDFARAATDLGYHIQEAWYTEALEAEGIELDGFVFIVVEKEAPFLVGVNQLDVIFRGMGSSATREARKRWRECTASGEWPGYSENIQLASPPAWAAMLSEELYGE